VTWQQNDNDEGDAGNKGEKERVREEGEKGVGEAQSDHS